MFDVILVVNIYFPSAVNRPGPPSSPPPPPSRYFPVIEDFPRHVCRGPPLSGEVFFNLDSVRLQELVMSSHVSPSMLLRVVLTHNYTLFAFAF